MFCYDSEYLYFAATLPRAPGAPAAGPIDRERRHDEDLADFDRVVLSLDIDSLVMHAAAALGARECRWPDDCRVYKPSHPNVSGARVKQVWVPWQRALDNFLSSKVSQPAALWALPGRRAHRSRVSIHRPGRSAKRATGFSGRASHLVSKWPIWLAEAA